MARMMRNAGPRAHTDTVHGASCTMETPSSLRYSESAPRVAHLVHGPCLHRGWWRADTSSPPYKEKSLLRIFKSGRRKHTICLSHHTPLHFFIFMKVPSNRFKSFHVTSCNFKASRASCHGKFPGERQTRNTNPIHPGPIRTDLVE